MNPKDIFLWLKVQMVTNSSCSGYKKYHAFALSSKALCSAPGFAALHATSLQPLPSGTGHKKCSDGDSS